MLTVSIKYKDKKYTYPKGVSLLEISKDFQNEFKDKIIVSIVDGIISELSTKIFNNSTVDFYDKNSELGNKVYQSGLLFILIKAFKDLYNARVKINHSIDKGIYIRATRLINESVLEKVKEKMDDIIKQDLIIDKLLINRKEAIRFYLKEKEYDKVELLKYNTNTNINLYKLDNIYDYFFNHLPVSTGYMKEFRLYPVDKESFVLSFPNLYSKKIDYKHHEKLFDSYEDYYRFSNKIGIGSICDLNRKVTEGNINDYVFLAETYQNNKLLKIAENICNNNNIKIVLISGPSSSGKTTTSKK